MRPLWKELALRWLGGNASEAPAGDSGFFDALIDGDAAVPAAAFRVTHEPSVSPQATESSPEPAIALQQEPVADKSESA